jgi:soluble lytic murein transglycosylase-like protein
LRSGAIAPSLNRIMPSVAAPEATMTSSAITLFNPGQNLKVGSAIRHRPRATGLVALDDPLARATGIHG